MTLVLPAPIVAAPSVTPPVLAVAVLLVRCRSCLPRSPRRRQCFGLLVPLVVMATTLPRFPAFTILAMPPSLVTFGAGAIVPPARPPNLLVPDLFGFVR